MGVDGDAGVQPGPGHAARGRRRRRGDRAGVPRPRHDHPRTTPGPTPSRRTGDGVVVELADGRHGRRLARADGGRVGAEHRRPGPGRVRRAASAPAATSPSTGCPAPTSPASTPPATAPACCRWPASPPCRAGSRCGTRSARRSRRCGCRPSSANVFTDPELATVGVSQSDVDSGKVPARAVMLPLAGNARAKMADLHDGFVKLFCRPAIRPGHRRRRGGAEGERADPADRAWRWRTT